MPKSKHSESVPLRPKIFGSPSEISQGIEKLRSRIVQAEELKKGATVAQGTIKKLVSDRGFGFILPDGEQGNNDLFFHRSDVQGAGYDALREGDRVSFDIGTDQRRGTPKADNVRAG